MIARQRKVDVNQMAAEDRATLEASLGGKLSKILADASAEANRIFNIYGLEVVINFDVRQVADNLNDSNEKE